MKLLIKDRFFHNADVLSIFALSFEYQDSSKILTDVGWRGHRTEEFDLLDNKIINEASQKILETVCKFYNLKGYSITSHFHISTEETKKTLEDFDNDHNIICTFHYHKQSLVKPNYYVEEKGNDWIVYPWETRDSEEVQDYLKENE